MLPQAPQSFLEGCRAFDPEFRNAYGYVPHLAAGIIFDIVFGSSMIIQLYRSIRHRRWTSYMLFLGALVELLGWASRTWSSKCPYNKTAFTIQISTLVIAPVFYAAAIYLLLGRLIVRRGPQFSLLKPRAYIWTFCSADLTSLFIQAAGGGLASAESDSNKSAAPGTHIIVAGILFQLVSMSIFSACFMFFLYKSKHVQTPKNEQRAIFTLATALLFVYIRSVYRTIELFQGWEGYLITHEPFFSILDGAMIAVASWAFNIGDPALLLSDDDQDVFAKRNGHAGPVTSASSEGDDVEAVGEEK